MPGKGRGHEAQRVLESVPEELCGRAQWVDYRLEGGEGKPKPDKVPYSAKTGRRASSTNPAALATLEEALEALQTGIYDGVGFVCSANDPLCGVDLDGCRDPDTGRLEGWAAQIVSRLDSYSEASPSGTGVHVFVLGSLPPGRRREGCIEMYDSGRFFTFTGERLPGAPETVEERQEELSELHREVFGEGGTRPVDAAWPAANGDGPVLSDDETLALCRRAQNAAKFGALFDRGDTSGHGGDHSRADQALVSMLAFYSQDPDQLDRLFRASALYRPEKWGKRADYRRRTIGKAVAGLGEIYRLPGPAGGLARNGSGGTRGLGGPEANGSGGGPGEPDGAAPDIVDGAAPNCTDLGNARRLVARHGEDLRYCYERRQWLVYEGGRRWAWDTTGECERRAKDVVNVILGEAQRAPSGGERKKLARWALATEGAGRIKSLMELARSEPGIAVSVNDLDRDRWLLNCANGTLDLRTGELREHRREDLIARYVDVEYDPTAKALIFEQFLARVLPSVEIRGWIQEYAGASLTGDTSERVFAILHGRLGKNGKSTLVETLRKAAGGNDGYALTAAPETLLAKRSGGVPNDIARLAGARMVTVSETEKGRRLAEGLLKQMTGGQDTMSARYMRGEWFDFVVTHKIWLSTNARPVIKGTDEAIWDRVRLVPFEERIPPEEQDKKLPRKLEEELPGILAWAVEGCLRWRRDGMSEPEEIMAATREYRQEMDVLGDFLAERCVTHSRAEVGAGALYDAYKGWCDETGEEPVTQKAFGSELKDRGYDNSGRISGGPEKGKKKWAGIGLLSPDDPLDGGGGGGEPSPPGGEPSDPENSSPEGNNGTDRPRSGEGKVHPGELSGAKVHRENPANTSGKTFAAEGGGEPSEPSFGINGSNPDPRDAMQEQGSLHSLGSPGSEDRLREGGEDPLAGFLAAPPAWWRVQAAECLRRGSPERLVRPLATATATEVLGEPHHWRRALPAVEEALRRIGSGAGEEDT